MPPAAPAPLALLPVPIPLDRLLARAWRSCSLTREPNSARVICAVLKQPSRAVPSSRFFKRWARRYWVIENSRAASWLAPYNTSFHYAPSLFLTETPFSPRPRSRCQFRAIKFASPQKGTEGSNPSLTGVFPSENRCPNRFASLVKAMRCQQADFRKSP